MTPRRNVPVVRTTAEPRTSAPSASRDAIDAVARQKKIATSPSIDLQSFRRRLNRLHGSLRVQLAVRLCARALHRGSLAAVQQAELDAGKIRNAIP
jgi:hypothetical protein